jgi:hypothetical protein
VFYLQATLTTTVFVNFGDISITRQTSFFTFLCVWKNLQNGFATDAENVHHLQEIQATTRNLVASRCIVVLFGTSLSEYALLNTSRMAANDF